MPFVLDASTTANWFLPEDRNAHAAFALRSLSEDYAIVPGLWWFEIRNVLFQAERKKRMTEIQTQYALEKLSKFSIRSDVDASSDDVMSLARCYGLTVYDAVYLELAIRRNYRLATLDKDLIKAAPAEGVELLTA